MKFLKNNWLLIVVIVVAVTAVVYYAVQSLGTNNNAENNTEDVLANMDHVYSETTEFFKFEEDCDKIASMLERREPGIYYFGFPECPWCKELLPILESALKRNNQFAYVTHTRSAPYTSEIKSRVKQFFVENGGDPDKFYVPYVVVIAIDHQVFTHVATIDGHEAPERQMTEQEKEQLFNILNGMVMSQNTYVIEEEI